MESHVLEDVKPSTATQEKVAPLTDANTAVVLRGVDDSFDYPKAWALGFITLALALAVFLTALDNLIIATAIPFITTEFNSLDDVGWYGAAYLITTGGFQLFWAKIYTLAPIKWIFLSSVTIFELGSLICGVAPNSVSLIIGRAVAGLGCAGLFSGAMVIMAYAVPLNKRPIYMGFFGGMYAIASVVGPLLGGVFTDKVSWRWCFYVNLPIGAVTIAVIVLCLKHPRQESMSHLTWKERFVRMDIPGNAMFMLTVICLLLAIQWGGVKYHWQNARIIVLLVVAFLLCISFIVLQIRLGDKATVPPRIFKIRSIYVACIYSFLLAGAMFYTIYYLPIWFQAVQGVSAVESGIRNLPLILSMTVATMISGGLVTLLGYYVPFMIFGGCIMAIGMGMISTFTPASGKGMWIGYQVFVGVGIGSGMQQALLAVQTVLNNTDLPIGTGLVIFAQTLGGAIGIIIGQSIFSHELLKNLAKFVPSLNPTSVTNLGASNLQKGVPAQYLLGVKLAYNDSVATAFYVGVAFASVAALAACAMEWKSVKHGGTPSTPKMLENGTASPETTASSSEHPQQESKKPADTEKDESRLDPDISLHNVYQSPEEMVRGEFGGSLRGNGALRSLSRSEGRVDLRMDGGVKDMVPLKL